MRTEKVILANLLYNEKYSRKVLPYISSEYFQDPIEGSLFRLVSEYVNKYNSFPSNAVLLVELEQLNTLSQDHYDGTVRLVRDLQTVETNKDEKWLLETTEKWCQDKAVYNAIFDSIKILEGKHQSLNKTAIPKILQDALGISFDSSIGHDFLDDATQRFEFYNAVEEKVPFNLDYMNRITRGGLSNKTLNLILAHTGAGKTLFMCHCAAANLIDQKNVLYITLEMAQERIAERIDANLLDIPIEMLPKVPKDVYNKKIERLKANVKGKLIIKEFPTASVGSAHFRHLLNELRIKKNFIPDVIYVDYLNLCISSRIKAGSNANSYTLVKAIAEELRGLAVEFDVPIITATQTTRAGIGNSDLELTDVSESIGLAATVDFMVGLISTEELAQLGQVMVKQLKNRYSDPEKFKRFVLGVDKTKMRLYDVESSAQSGITKDVVVMDQTDMGTKLKKSQKEFK